MSKIRCTMLQIIRMPLLLGFFLDTSDREGDEFLRNAKEHMIDYESVPQFAKPAGLGERRRKRWVFLLLIIILLVLIFTVVLPPIKIMEDGGALIRGEKYYPTGSYRFLELGRPIARDGLVLLYSLKNDPNRVILYQRTWLSVPRVMLAREGAPHPSTNEIDRINVSGITLSKEAVDAILSVYQRDYLQEFSYSDYYSFGEPDEEYYLCIYFKDYPAAYYVVFVSRYGSQSVIWDPRLSAEFSLEIFETIASEVGDGCQEVGSSGTPG